MSELALPQEQVLLQAQERPLGVLLEPWQALSLREQKQLERLSSRQPWGFRLL